MVRGAAIRGEKVTGSLLSEREYEGMPCICDCGGEVFEIKYFDAPKPCRTMYPRPCMGYQFRVKGKNHNGLFFHCTKCHNIYSTSEMVGTVRYHPGTKITCIKCGRTYTARQLRKQGVYANDRKGDPF